MSRFLQDIQVRFQDYVLNGTGDHQDILADISAHYGLQADDRLAIYHNAYRLRLQEALSEAFGKTRMYIGDETFAELCLAYVQTHPSHSPNLRWYGNRFPAFLAQALPDYPVVAELAAFEWALGISFDAADAPVIRAEDLQAADIDWETIGFDLQPSLQFLPMQYNTVPVWLALDQDQTPPDAVATTSAVEWLIWRKDLQSHFRSLSDDEAQALHRLAQGESFSSVCSAMTDSAGDEDATAQIAGWLQTWLNEGILARVRHSGTPPNRTPHSFATP